MYTHTTPYPTLYTHTTLYTTLCLVILKLMGQEINWLGKKHGSILIPLNLIQHSRVYSILSYICNSLLWPISLLSYNSLQENSRKSIYFCFIDYAKAFDSVDHNKLWEILQEMGIPDHLTCLLRNLYAGQEATVRTGHGTIDWFQIGKRVHQGCIWSPCLFNLYAEHIMWNAKLDEAQAESRLPGEISITSDMQMIPP